MNNAIFFAFGMPGGSEWFIILVIALLLFGKRLPEVARSMGKSITEFKKGVRGAEDEINNSLQEADDISREAGK